MTHSRSTSSLSRASPSPWAWGPSPAPSPGTEGGQASGQLGSRPQQGALGPPSRRGLTCWAALPSLPRPGRHPGSRVADLPSKDGPWPIVPSQALPGLPPPSSQTRSSPLASQMSASFLTEPPSGTRAGPEQPSGICRTSVPRAQGAAGNLPLLVQVPTCPGTQLCADNGSLGPAGHSGPFPQSQGG